MGPLLISSGIFGRYHQTCSIWISLHTVVKEKDASMCKWVWVWSSAFPRGGELAFLFFSTHFKIDIPQMRGHVFTCGSDFCIQNTYQSAYMLHLNWVYICQISTRSDFCSEKLGLVIWNLGWFGICFSLSESCVSHFVLILGWSITSRVLSAVVQGSTHWLAMCRESKFQPVPLSPDKHNTQHYVTR